MAYIECRNISKAYSTDISFSGTKKQRALTSLDLSVAQGEVFGIVGPNGAGKSTLLKILMGFVSPDQGEALISGKQVSMLDVRRQVGYLPENPSLYKHLSVTDHLVFAAQMSGMPRSERERRIDEILNTVNLNHAAKLPIESFSKGMKQRAALAYALFLKPEILILDEPMSGLDPLGRHLVVEIIRRYKEINTTILFCSHILADVENICTRIGIMNKGEMKAITSPGELLHLSSEDSQNRTSGLETYFINILTENSN